jgi:hypothetical protein
VPDLVTGRTISFQDGKATLALGPEAVAVLQMR